MTRDIEILQFLHYNPKSSRSEISAGINNPPSEATLKRLLAAEVAKGNIDSVEYKKAMLMFYEQNNIAAFKKIFIDQYLFAVKTYF